jgi:hypothetical protein
MVFVLLLVSQVLSSARALLRISVVTISPAFLLAQPPPPQLDSNAVERRLGEIRNRLERNAPTNAEQRELAAYVQRYLDEAARALASGRRFQAQRFADAADACRRPIEHLQHLTQPNQGKPGPPKPPGDLEDHLRQVYFRLRLSEFFLEQIPSPAPTRLLELARGFYEKAAKAQQGEKTTTADEYTKSADDLTHALESLAQANVP